MNKHSRWGCLVLVASLVLLSVWNVYGSFDRNPSMPLSQLYQFLDERAVERLEWQDEGLTAEMKDGSIFYIRAFDVESNAGADLIRAALKSGATLNLRPSLRNSTLLSITSILAVPLFIVAMIYLLVFRPLQSPSSGVFRQGTPGP